jgi:hypothetical protein
MRTLGTCCAIWLMLLGQAAARDIFVNNVAGDDSLTGAQSRNSAGDTGPVKSIAKALRLAMAGDHILLADTGQPYRESVSLVGTRHGGIPTMPLVIDGQGATLDGSATIPSDRWVLWRENVYRFRPPQAGYYHLFLDGRPAVCAAAKADSSVPPKLEPRQWCSYEGYFYFAVEKDKMPEDYQLSYACLPTGMTLFHVENVIIKNLTLQGFQVDGLAASNSARYVVLSEVNCLNNGRCGFSIGGASLVELTDCKAAGNGVAQLWTAPFCELHLWQSEMPDDSAPGWIDQGGRVFLGEKRVVGGLKAIKLQDAPRKADAAKPDKKKSGASQPAEEIQL